MKYINISLVCWFSNFFVVLEIKVAPINYSLPNATSKATENNGLIELLTHLPLVSHICVNESGQHCFR